MTRRPAHRKRARMRGAACTCPRVLHLLLGIEPAVLPAAVRIAAPPGALLCQLRVRLDLQPPALRPLALLNTCTLPKMPTNTPPHAFCSHHSPIPGQPDVLPHGLV